MSQELVRKYETVVIFAPRLNDSQLRDEVKKVEGILTNQKCQDLKVDFWGRKEISYFIKKERVGHYVAFNYETENFGAANHLGSLLRITDSVNKFQTHSISSRKRKFQGNPNRSRSADAEFYDEGNDSFE